MSKKCYLKDYYLVKKKVPKNSGMGRPPPPLSGQSPKENVFFRRMSSLRGHLAAEDKNLMVMLIMMVVIMEMMVIKG